MRSKMFVLIAALVGAVVIFLMASDVASGGGGGSKAPAVKPRLVPMIAFTAEEAVFDPDNTIGTYSSIEKFESTKADADVKIRVGTAVAYLHIGYGFKYEEVKNKKTGKVTNVRVIDHDKVLLEAYLPNADNLKSDDRQYAGFMYMSTTIRWGALVKKATVPAGACIRMDVNGTSLGRFSLEKKLTGGAGLTVYRIKVTPPETENTSTGVK